MHSIDQNVVRLGWVSYFTDLASAMVNPILPIFVITVLHEGMDKLGVIVAVATFVSYALRMVSGYIADYYGVVKPLVVGGYLFSALSKPLLGFSHGWGSIAALRALERVGKGVRSAPKDLMIASYARENAHGKTFGFHKTMDIAGEFSGTLLLFGLLWYFGDSEGVIRTLFFATLIPGLIGLVIVIFFVRDIPKRVQCTERFRLSSADKKTVLQLFFYFLFLFFIFSEAFFTVQAKTVGIATALIPLLFAVSTGVQTLTSYLFGLGSDRFGSGAVNAFGYGCGIVAQALLWLQMPAATWAAFAFLGLFTVATLNANRAMIAQQAENRGSVYGIFYAAVALFAAAGAAFGGWLWEQFGMQTALDVALGGTLAVSVLYGLKKGLRG
ncbi:MFS transporter [Sulfurimonas sp. HSL1-6]|uniref:MFS transporter n=1 Tax=Thiomicrolovo immobilis TaxID=3131935 RepID=UPI0031F97500